MCGDRLATWRDMVCYEFRAQIDFSPDKIRTSPDLAGLRRTSPDLAGPRGRTSPDLSGLDTLPKFQIAVSPELGGVERTDFWSE